MLLVKPDLCFENMGKEEMIKELLLVREILISIGYTILPVFLHSNIEDRNVIDYNQSLEKILIQELKSPWRLVSENYNQTDNGDLFLERQRNLVFKELSNFSHFV